MVLYRKMLACIDGSEESFHAFEEAVKFAKRKNITVLVLTVAPSYHGDLSLLGIGVSVEEISKPYKENISKAKDIADKHQVLVKTLYEEGEPFEKIVDVSEEISADLIVYDEQVNKTKKYLKELELKFHGENISPRIFIEEGEPYRKILEKTDEIQADIIVVGSHGRTGLKRLLMGSTCQRVIGLSKVPVLVVKS